MKHAHLATSDRLRRTLAALLGAEELSSLELCQRAGIVAVSAAISELRANGVDIACTKRHGLWFYRLTHPEAARALLQAAAPVGCGAAGTAPLSPKP